MYQLNFMNSEFLINNWNGYPTVAGKVNGECAVHTTCWVFYMSIGLLDKILNSSTLIWHIYIEFLQSIAWEVRGMLESCKQVVGCGILFIIFVYSKNKKKYLLNSLIWMWFFFPFHRAWNQTQALSFKSCLSQIHKK